MCFLLHKFKMITSPDAFFFFSKFFWVGAEGGQKLALNDKEIVSLHISGTVPDCGFWYTSVKWYLQFFCCFLFFIFIFIYFFSPIFRNSDFLGFSKLINKRQKEIVRCASCVWFLSYIMTWYMNLLTLSYPLQYASRLVT